ncbi:hypothetical protein BC936DRAFT_146931, partial [Jimgerdemannia flammicorona]
LSPTTELPLPPSTELPPPTDATGILPTSANATHIPPLSPNDSHIPLPSTNALQLRSWWSYFLREVLVLYEMTFFRQPIVTRSLVLMLGCFLAVVFPKSTVILCQVPVLQVVIRDCTPPPLVEIPNIPIFLNAHLETMQTYNLALRGNYSQELLKTRSAMRDLESQVKHSDLSSNNREVFVNSLNLLWKATTQAAYNMETLEAKTAVTFRLFIDRSRMIQRALTQLEKDTDGKLLANLMSIFEEAMTDANDGMEILDLQVGTVLKNFVTMESYLAGAYDVAVKEKNVQCEKKASLAKVWADWGTDHVQHTLLANNLNILQKFEGARVAHMNELILMSNALRKFREQVDTLRQTVKTPLLEKGIVRSHVQLVNQAINELEAQYRKYQQLN